MDGSQENRKVIGLVQGTLQANKEHLHALETYTETLEAELESFDKLLDAADTFDESDLDVGSSVTIPGSVRATAPIATKELLSPESPFHEDALKRSHYQNVSEAHSMKPKELEALAEAVQAESYRGHALDIQKSGFPASLNTDFQTAQSLGPNDAGIDWNRIAEKVSAVSITTRTPRECEILWLGEQHPDFNHEPWTQDEVLKVKSLAAEFTDSGPDWAIIAKRLGTKRTPLDCMRRATSRKSHQWTTKADERLLKAIRIYGHENWHLVARHVSEDVTPSQCSSRFQKTLDDSIKRAVWTSEEDARLSAAVAAYGSSWVDVAANLPGRHNDQCRDRWTEQLNPSINKSQWSEEEDRVLVDYVREHQDASWKQISEHVRNGRTEAMCRSRYAALQRSTNTPLAMPVVTSGDQSAFVDQEAESSNSVSTSSTPFHTKFSRPNEFVFLEPVVSSNVEPHGYHKPHPSQHKTRFKITTAGDISYSNTATNPSSKKRKT